MLNTADFEFWQTKTSAETSHPVVIGQRWVQHMTAAELVSLF
jgi:hypothetical protein